MFYISEVTKTAPQVFATDLQESVYKTLAALHIPFERVETDEAITMDDCVLINQKLHMDMVKTLFLCNRQQTEFYLFITRGDKPFSAKNFSHALGSARPSFAPAELMQSMLGTKIGAATVFSMLADDENRVTVVMDKEVADRADYGCSDGTTTGYMKLKTSDILEIFLPHTGHVPVILEV